MLVYDGLHFPSVLRPQHTGHITAGRIHPIIGLDLIYTVEGDQRYYRQEAQQQRKDPVFRQQKTEGQPGDQIKNKDHKNVPVRISKRFPAHKGQEHPGYRIPLSQRQRADQKINQHRADKFKQGGQDPLYRKLL